LNRIVTMYLEFAEDQARRRKTMTMADWAGRLDDFLSFNERDVLSHAGKLRAEVAEKLALTRYGEFDTRRRQAERLAADDQDLRALEEIRDGRSSMKTGD